MAKMATWWFPYRPNRHMREGNRHGRITREWVAKLAARLEVSLTRPKRVHFKSLGGLLACQERLAVQVQRVVGAVRGA